MVGLRSGIHKYTRHPGLRSGIHKYQIDCGSEAAMTKIAIMSILTKINRIPFKYVLGMNLAVLVMAVTFVSINTVNRNTETRSQAKEAPYSTSLTQIIIDPQNPPTLLNPDPDWAKVGDAILVRGKNLGQIPFGELFLGDIKVPSENIVEWAPDHIVFTVPDNSTTNPIYLKIEDLVLTSSRLTITTKNK